MSMPTQVDLNWSADGTPSDLAAMLRALGEEYPLHETSAADAGLRFSHDPDRRGYVIERAEGPVTVRYGALSQAGRAIGSLLAGLERDTGSVPAFDTLGILLDCGHNATVTPEHFRVWLRRLALLGYNVAMVYTEAGYRLPDEPAFGYKRGSYTLEQMRALDEYAATLGIEMIGSIQALGHLEQVLKWSPYLGLRDTEHTLLVGDSGTAALVEKMIAFWTEAFRSRRLHVGMDETYDLGRGRSLDLHGYRPGLELYTEHLRLVAQTCERHGIRPIVWSDVLFKLAGGATHYDSSSRIPDEIRTALPRNVDLAYWDYYSPDQQHYRDRIEAHRALGYEPVMTSAVWSWPTPWHNWQHTEQFGGACVAACRESGVREMVFSMWSDDGAFWDLDSSLAGVTLMAEHCYGDGSVDEAALAGRFAAVCGSDLAAHRAASRMNDRLQVCGVLWDDPLQATYLRYAARESLDVLRDASGHYRDVADELAGREDDASAGDLGHALIVAEFLAAKTALAARLFDAYDTEDRAALQAVRADVAGIVPLIETLAESFRRRWLACCQPFGLEVIQIRFAGQAARYRELDRRLGEYLAGETETIAEIEEAKRGAYLPARSLSYRALASGARVF